MRSWCEEMRIKKVHLCGKSVDKKINIGKQKIIMKYLKMYI